MAEHGRLRRCAGQHRPRPLVERLVEAGQHDRAVGQAGDRRQQLGGGGDRAGRAGRDHRAGAAGCACRRSASRRISALRCAAGLDWPRAARTSGQCAVTIDRKSSVTCHQPARLSGRQLAKLRPVGAFGLDLVDQRGEVARQPDGVGRRSRHDHLLLEQRGDMRRQPALPGAHQRRQLQQAVERRIGGARSIAPAPSALEGRLVLVELAERPDRRQDRRAAGRAVRRRRARSSRAARRVGTKMVVSASVSGSPSWRSPEPAGPTAARRPASAGTATPGGIERTRGSVRSLMPLRPAPARPRPRRAGWRRACRR